MATDVTPDWRGRQLVGTDGSKIGKVDDIYLDDQTGRPEWALVTTGLLGGKGSFVPLAEASADADEIRVPYDKNMVKAAPAVDADGELSVAEEEQLWRHYGLEYGEQSDITGRVGSGGERTTGRDVDRTTGDAMTRSEEELRVAKTQRESGRVRLHKWIETQHVTQTVPVQREQVRIEREPITDANIGDATSGRELTEDTYEVVLHEEQAVADKVVVPKERIRLGKETVTEEQQVTEQLRREQIQVDEDVDRR